jgi:hypothetical protein
MVSQKQHNSTNHRLGGCLSYLKLTLNMVYVYAMPKKTLALTSAIISTKNRMSPSNTLPIL